MLLAHVLEPTSVEAIEAVLLAVVAAYVAIRTRQLDAADKATDQRADAHREYCEGLEKRVKKLENLAKRSPRAKPRRKRPKTRRRK